MKHIVALFCVGSFLISAHAADEYRELLGSKGPVRGAKYTPDGTIIVSCTGWPKGDGIVRVWDVKTGKVLREMKGHEGDVDSLAISSDGKRAATGGHDNTTRVWELATGKELFVFKGHTMEIPALAFSPDDKFLATGSHDKLIKIWDLSTGKEVRTIKGHEGEVRCLAYYDKGTKLVSGDWKMTMKTWNATTGKEISSWIASDDKVNVLSMVPGTMEVVVGHANVSRYACESGKSLQTLTGHNTPITAIAVSRDGKRIVSGTYHGEFRVWDLTTGKELARFQAHIGACWTLDFSPDGKQIVTGGSGNLTNGKGEPGDDFAIRIWQWDN